MKKLINFILSITFVLNRLVGRILIESNLVHNISSLIEFIILILTLWFNRELFKKNKSVTYAFIFMGFVGFSIIGLFYANYISLSHFIPTISIWAAVIVMFSLYGFIKNSKLGAYIKAYIFNHFK